MDTQKLQHCQQDQLVMDNEPPIYNAQPMPISVSTTFQNVPQSNPAQFFRPVGPKSMEMTCPSCRCRIKTTVRHRSTAKTHIGCLLLTGVCCCCLPYCMDSCRNANHFCPMCETFIGTYAS